MGPDTVAAHGSMIARSGSSGGIADPSMCSTALVSESYALEMSFMTVLTIDVDEVALEVRKKAFMVRLYHCHTCSRFMTDEWLADHRSLCSDTCSLGLY